MYSQDIGYKQQGHIYDRCFSWSRPSSTNIASTAAYSYHWPPTMALGLCWPINAVSFLQLYIHTIIHTQSQLKYPTMPAYTVITPASIEVDFTPWFPRHPKISKKAEVWPFRNLAATAVGAFGEICDQHMYIYIYMSIYRLHNMFQWSTSASKKDNSYDILDNLWDFLEISWNLIIVAIFFRKRWACFLFGWSQAPSPPLPGFKSRPCHQRFLVVVKGGMVGEP